MAQKHELTEGHKLRLQGNIIQGAKNYETYLNDKSFKIICEDNSETIVRFFQKDFKHLTGIDSNLDEDDFYDMCRLGTISTGNIETEQKYNWDTLRGKTNRIVNIHDLLYTDAEKTLLLNQLKVNTTEFPVAIRNDNIKTCVAFASNANRARSLRKAGSSHDTKEEKKIIAIYGRKNGDEDFTEIVYKEKTNSNSE